MMRAANLLFLSCLTALASLAATACGGREPATPQDARTVIAVVPAGCSEARPANEVTPSLSQGELAIGLEDPSPERPRAARLHETLSLGYAGDSPLTQIPPRSSSWDDDGRPPVGGYGYGGYSYGGYGFGVYGHGHGPGHSGVASSGPGGVGGGRPVGQNNLIVSPSVRHTSVSGRGPSGGATAPRPSGGRRGPR